VEHFDTVTVRVRRCECGAVYETEETLGRLIVDPKDGQAPPPRPATHGSNLSLFAAQSG
jgi:hypothetical protein